MERLVPYIETKNIECKKMPKNLEICGLISNVLFSSKYLDLYRKQERISKLLGEWAKENEGSCDVSYFSSEYLSFDGDMVIYNDSFEEPHLFEIKDGKINEISLVPENLSKYVMCKDIKIITSGIYYVVLDRCDDYYQTINSEQSKFEGCSYFINKYGEKIPDDQEKVYRKMLLESQNKNNNELEDKQEMKDIRKDIEFGERFKDINRCVVIFDDERETASIKNVDGKILYTVENFSEFHENEYYPMFLSDEKHVIINYRKVDSNVLFVKEINNPYDRQKSDSKVILINKKTGERKYISGYEGQCPWLHGNLVEVFSDPNKSKIYDENFNELGDTIRATGDLNFFAVKRHENGDERCYLCLAETGKILCEIGDKREGQVIKSTYFDEDKNRHTIVKTVDGTLIDIVSNN